MSRVHHRLKDAKDSVPAQLGGTDSAPAEKENRAEKTGYSFPVWPPGSRWLSGQMPGMSYIYLLSVYEGAALYPVCLLGSRWLSELMPGMSYL